MRQYLARGISPRLPDVMDRTCARGHHVLDDPVPLANRAFAICGTRPALYRRVASPPQGEENENCARTVLFDPATHGVELRTARCHYRHQPERAGGVWRWCVPAEPRGLWHVPG